MQYVAAVSGRDEEVGAIKEHILRSTPVLEAFGNAKTHRNDNSSRFRSMEALGLSQSEVHAVFQVVAVVLKLGNVEFQPRANIDDTESCALLNEYELYEICELLRVDFAFLHSALTQKMVETRHDVAVTDLSANEAKRLGKRKCLGILDIYGFEVLEKNCFEQFVINYCNEKLEQLFIVLTLKQEQEEYVREGIQWEHIDYFNNAIICDLIEKNNHGILAMLDEECLRPGPATDESFLYKLTKVCQDSPYFESKGCKNLTGADVSLPPQCFRLRHYAGAVTYSVVGFIDKNNDHLYRDLSQAMYSCDHPLMKVLFPEGNPKRTTLKRPTTTATQFKISIGALVKNLQAKTPNYVRCIKASPNELKQPMIFEMALVQHQVRYLGLLENLRVRRAGFAFRQDYVAFLERYKLLSVRTWPQWTGLPIEGVTLLLRDLPIRPSEYVFGRTKIFIKSHRTRGRGEKLCREDRAPQPELRADADLLGYASRAAVAPKRSVIRKDAVDTATDIGFGAMVCELEEFRRERLNELAVLIQKTWRGFVMRERFLRMRDSQVILSSNYKCWKTREEFHGVRQARKRECAARVLGRSYRLYKRRRYLLWLARNLPSDSPADRSWPPAPRFLMQTSHLLRKLHHKWRCTRYKQKLDQTARNRMREKMTASIIFKDNKASYPKSVSHPFRGDYVRLRQNVKWKRLSDETGDQYIVFADIISKITRSSGKCVQTLFVVSTNAMLIMDQRTLQIKYRIPVTDIYRISLSPFLDDIAVFHIRTTEATRKKGDFIFETGHVIEIVTKLFLVIQNATGKTPEVNFSTEFEVNFGKEMGVLAFRCTSMADHHPGQIRIYRKGNRMEVLL
ncbi:hypothetical protein HPB50_014721 [Hyalomma asiaticum]|uniref:Uncharacterized protein n=1 Tax=Hyalomma asiaticum TaxID=266040 RepID=A0ACB7S7E7_HYAAI|nr:hypothetical protein HPB50_014721 [Hyalomma asiaticum]